jgi:ABC-type sugar transport system substrate-binding protein
MRSPNDQSLTELANAAFEQAAKKVIQRAIETGTPVILWENDSVKKVDPKTIIRPEKPC